MFEVCGRFGHERLIVRPSADGPPKGRNVCTKPLGLKRSNRRKRRALQEDSLVVRSRAVGRRRMTAHHIPVLYVRICSGFFVGRAAKMGLDLCDNVEEMAIGRRETKVQA